MSEELAKLASHFYDKYDGDCDFEAKRCVVDFAVEFASQVCEQREKEVNDKWERDVGHDWDAIGHALKMPPHIPRRLTEILQAIEAAELALQKWVKAMDGRTPECAAEDLLNATATCSDLRATLQAKEQELGQQKEGQEYLRDQIHTILQLPAYSLWTNVGLIEALTMRIESLAQARQQAVAECARIVFDEGYEAVAHRLRSLTPPPALTPKIERRVGKERRDPAGTQPYSWKNGRKGERRKKFPSLTKEK